jgi:putative membrane protein
MKHLFTGESLCEHLRMNAAVHKKARIAGALAGTAFAVALLPGLSVFREPWAPEPEGFQVVVSVFLTGAIVKFLATVIFAYPREIRSAPPAMTGLLGVIGIVQDALGLLAVSWLAGNFGVGVTADGFATCLLGGAIIRLTTLAALALPARAPGES